MASCPNCNHNPTGLSSNWMYLKKCRDCGKVFCHSCEKPGKKCSKCGSANVAQSHQKVYGH